MTDTAASRPGEDLLLGPASLDRYLPDGPVLPGGGAFNMAWHLRRLGVPSRLLTRIGDDDPRLFLDVLERHGIPFVPGSIVTPGPSSAIDIEIQADRQPWMDHFVEGVWSDLTWTDEERDVLAGGRRLHAVLVEPVIAALERGTADGTLGHLGLSVDFLGFRHYTVDRFARTLALVDLGFVGWPGDPSDATVAQLGAATRDLGKRLVVTFGSRGVLVVDGRTGAPDAFVPVEAVEVRGTTVGCGDAFIAWFLAEYWRSGDLLAAVEHGKTGGALTTAWERPLPDDAY